LVATGESGEGQEEESSSSLGQPGLSVQPRHQPPAGRAGRRRHSVLARKSRSEARDLMAHTSPESTGITVGQGSQCSTWGFRPRGACTRPSRSPYPGRGAASRTDQSRALRAAWRACRPVDHPHGPCPVTMPSLRVLDFPVLGMRRKVDQVVATSWKDKSCTTCRGRPWTTSSFSAPTTGSRRASGFACPGGCGPKRAGRRLSRFAQAMRVEPRHALRRPGHLSRPAGRKSAPQPK